MTSGVVLPDDCLPVREEPRAPSLMLKTVKATVTNAEERRIVIDGCAEERGKYGW